MVIRNIPRLQGIQISFLLSYSSKVYLDETFNFVHFISYYKMCVFNIIFYLGYLLLSLNNKLNSQIILYLVTRDLPIKVLHRVIKLKRNYNYNINPIQQSSWSRSPFSRHLLLVIEFSLIIDELYHHILGNSSEFI